MARRKSQPAIPLLDAKGPDPFAFLCAKTQIALVRNLKGIAFCPESPKAAEALSRRIAETLKRRFGDDLTDLTADEGAGRALASLYEIHEYDSRPDGYRLFALRRPVGDTLLCEVLGANHLTFSLYAGGDEDFAERVRDLWAFVHGLEQDFDFACSERHGYLTAQLTLAGTGLRIRSWMHLRGLAHFGLLDTVRNFADLKHVKIDSGNHGDSAPGDLHIFFNAHTLGAPAPDIARHFQEVLRTVVRQEARALLRLYCDEPFMLYDRLVRLQATSDVACLLGEEEGLDLMADLRVGCLLGALRPAKRFRGEGPFDFFKTAKRLEVLCAPRPGGGNPFEYVEAMKTFEDVLDGGLEFLMPADIREAFSERIPDRVFDVRSWRLEALRALLFRYMKRFTIDPAFGERALES